MRKNILKIILLLAPLLFFLGCNTKYDHLPTSKSVDIDAYKGTWYEIARFEHFFEKEWCSYSEEPSNLLVYFV